MKLHNTFIGIIVMSLNLPCFCGCAAQDSIPFHDSLQNANVTIATMRDGQREGLILGNGDLYGIVWVKDNGLFMRITKNDIWDARVDTSKDGELPRVDLVSHKITGHVKASPSYDRIYPQPRCAAGLRLGPVPEDMTANLDIGRGAVNVTSAGKANTSLRVLHDRNVLLINSKHAVTLEEIKAKTLPDATFGASDGVQWLLMKMPGDMDYKGMDYALAVATKGDVKAISLVTSFDIDGGDVLKHAITLARNTIAEREDTLITKHEQLWREYWSRSGVQLEDKVIERWWYRTLYFAHTVCRPGAAPVGILPPLATDKTPWHADYHHNYNTWQAFWPLPASNHCELADPWISYNNDMIPRFKNLARETYGVDGLHVPISSFLHEPDPADCKSKNKRQMSMNPWGLTIGLAGMTLQSMWHKYQCDRDVEYMKEKIYPFLREAATFYVSFMDKCKTDAKGKVLLGPSFSPEHPPMGIFNCPFDIAYFHYTFDALIEAASALKVDKDLVQRCRASKKLLGEYPTIVHNGEEIVVDSLGGEYIPEHNITVPAAPVFPCDQVTWFSPDSTKALFKRTIKATRFRNANAHVMFNIARARLSMPEGVTEARKWFASRELPNGLFVWAGHGHGTFMPEMIGIAGLINEYLMQSVGNTIRVFPCWPADKDASFAGLRGQGGFLVSAEQKGGEVVKVEITSEVGGSLRLLSPWPKIAVRRGAGPAESLKPDAAGVVTLKTRPGEVLVFTRQ